MTVADPSKARAAIDPIVPIAVVAGVVLYFLTDAMSKTDIGGPGWSLKGNGSIAVLFGGGGALLAFGWLALAFGNRGERGYLNRALLGAAATLILELLFAFAPIALAPQLTASQPLLGFLHPYLLVLIIVCLGCALAVGVALAKGGLTAGLTVAIVALAASLAPFGLQFFLVPLFLPIVVAMPSLALAPNRWLLLNSMGILVALLLGLYGAQAVANR